MSNTENKESVPNFERFIERKQNITIIKINKEEDKEIKELTIPDKKVTERFIMKKGDVKIMEESSKKENSETIKKD